MLWGLVLFFLLKLWGLLVVLCANIFWGTEIGYCIIVGWRGLIGLVGVVSCWSITGQPFLLLGFMSMRWEKTSVLYQIFMFVFSWLLLVIALWRLYNNCCRLNNRTEKWWEKKTFREASLLMCSQIQNDLSAQQKGYCVLHPSNHHPIRFQWFDHVIKVSLPMLDPSPSDTCTDSEIRLGFFWTGKK